MRDLLAIVFMTGGALFMLLAAVGILRFPDALIRMHSLAKAGSFGIIGIMLAAIARFPEMGVVGPSISVILFFFATSPVSGHLLSRAAYYSGVRLWEKTHLDELAAARRKQEGGTGPAE